MQTVSMLGIIRWYPPWCQVEIGPLQMMPSCCRGNLSALVLVPNVISFFQVLTSIISLFSRGLKFMWNILKQFVSLRRGIIKFGVH
jgi:hypothetical protein